jgi:multimeric flavodoxin WrbA
MKVLLINGSPHEHGCTERALAEVKKTLEEEGMETEMYWIGTKPIAGCIACGSCRKTGRCVFEDGVNEVAKKLPGVDGLIVGSPIYYSAPNGQIQCFLDRLFHSAGKDLKGKPGAAVVSCRRGGASAGFERLNQYFLIEEMPLVASSYWNQVHGSKAEDVEKDEEGLQTMRTLGRNMAFLLKSLAAGKKAGITKKEPEERKRTDFIR